jgi:AraC-like DNA-binding protein
MADPAGFDVLSDVLSTARLHSRVLGRLDLRAPWALRMRDQSVSIFHIVLDGECVFGVDDGGFHRAQRGDVLLLSRGRAHALQDAARTRARAIEFRPGQPPPELPRGDGPLVELVCGAFRFEDRHTQVLLGTLPDVVHVGELAAPVQPWLGQTLALIDHETRHRGPGSQAVLAGLCDALFIHLLRTRLVDAATAETGWLGALRDPHVGEALRLIHADPGADWNVPSLAARVAMSRSAFTARFSELVGQSPLQYVIGWRAAKAAAMLRSSQHSIAEIAGMVGYETEAAFAKAFKRALGVTPGAYRSGSDKSFGGSDMERPSDRAQH